MLKNKAVILAKPEVTYGVDSAPGTANAILCGDLDYEVLDQKLERNNIQSYFGAKRFTAIGEGQKLSFSVELKGSGAAGTAPEIGPLIRACNYSQVISAGVSVTYLPHSNTFPSESLTIWYYMDGLLHKMTGCRGTFSLADAKVNQHARLKFEFTGLYGGGRVAGSVSGHTFNQTIPPVFHTGQFTLDTYAAIIDGISIDFKNDIAKRVSVNATNGILEWFIKDRAITAKIAPEMVLPATKDFWTMWESSGVVAMAVTFGQTAGNKCQIAAQYVQLDKLKYGDRENIVTAELPLVLNPNTGDDEVTITFT